MSKYETIGTYKIFLDETYYLAYAGGKRELSARDQKEYNKTLQLPFILQRKELHKIGFDKNPNLVPLKGRQLMAFIKELKFIPFFDQYFEHTKLLQLNDLIIYEAIKAKSYEMAMAQ
jgi:hypothetical protein